MSTEAAYQPFSPFIVTCCDPACTNPKIDVRRSGTYWQKLEGWDQDRKAGGHNYLALRRPFDEYLCDSCMFKRKAGLTEGQLAFE